MGPTFSATSYAVVYQATLIENLFSVTSSIRRYGICTCVFRESSIGEISVTSGNFASDISATLADIVVRPDHMRKKVPGQIGMIWALVQTDCQAPLLTIAHSDLLINNPDCAPVCMLLQPGTY